MPSSCLHFILVSAVLWFSLPVFAADRNMSEFEDSTTHNVCERLLEADLSGHFVVTDLKKKSSQLIQLRRLGHTSAYTVSTSSMELASHGIRELQFVRLADGWKIGDPHAPDTRVNVVALQREGEKIEFKFENASDPHGFTYSGNPEEERQTIQGDILNPNKWILRFQSPFDSEVQFTRVKLDKSFELAVSQSLKSLLASRLDPGENGIADYIVTVEMKKPLMPNEAEEVLGTQLIYPIDEVAGSNGPFYRFAVPKNIYELLESISAWTRHWEVAHIDAVPTRVLNDDLIRQILGKVKSAASPTVQPARASFSPPRPTTPAGPRDKSSSAGVLERLTDELLPRTPSSKETHSAAGQNSDQAGSSKGQSTPRDLDQPEPSKK